VTRTVPVVAPVGTTTVREFVVAETTVAATPLKVTESADGVVEKPLP
jgi:hypothetical protein